MNWFEDLFIDEAKHALNKHQGGGGSGGGGDDLAKVIAERTVTELKDDTITSVGNSAFKNCTALTSVELPNATKLDEFAFEDCTALTSLELPNVTNIGEAAFRRCSALTSLVLPKVTTLSGRYIPRDSGLKKIVFKSFVTITAYYALQTCPLYDFHVGFHCKGSSEITSNATVVIRNTESMSIVSGSCAFKKVYVPSSLVDSYKAGTNWSKFADIIFPLEDVTVDGTVMGELDESKI